MPERCVVCREKAVCAFPVDGDCGRLVGLCAEHEKEARKDYRESCRRSWTWNLRKEWIAEQRQQTLVPATV